MIITVDKHTLITLTCSRLRVALSIPSVSPGISDFNVEQKELILKQERVNWYKDLPLEDRRSEVYNQ